MSKTEKNLLEAFAGESQANRKYLAFAKQSDKEGFPQAAKLFRAAAEAETVHAHAHLRTLGGIKSTAVNIRKHPRMRDKKPTEVAMEGPDPQTGHWPPVKSRTLPEERILYPGEGIALLELDPPQEKTQNKTE